MHGNSFSLNQVKQAFLSKNFELLSEYQGAKVKVKAKCYCGKIFNVRPQSIFIGVTTSCGCKQKHSQSEIIKKFSNRKLKLLSEYKNIKTKVSVKCFCGNIFETIPQSILSGATRSCGCLLLTGPNKNSNKWNGYEEISGSFWAGLKHSAKSRNIEINLTIEDIWKIFEQQNRKCKLSGLELNFAKSQKDKNDTTASLDRIDSSGGYVQDNVQWVHKKVNIMKNKFNENEFIEICKKIAENQN